MQCCEERIISMMKEIMSKIINKIRDNKIIFFLRYSKMDRKQTFNYIYSHKKWGGQDRKQEILFRARFT